MAKFWEKKEFKIGLAIAGANVVGEYLFGETMPGGVSGEGPSYYSGDSLAAKGLNYFGVTPFGETAVGSAVSGAVSGLVPDWLKDTIGGTEAKKATASFLNMFGDMGEMPSTQRRTPSSFARSDTNFQAGRASLIPLGSNGRVNNAMQSPKMQAFLAQHVKATKIPSRILAQTRPTGTTTLGKVSVKRSATRTSPYTKDARTG